MREVRRGGKVRCRGERGRDAGEVGEPFGGVAGGKGGDGGIEELADVLREAEEVSFDEREGSERRAPSTASDPPP